MSRIPMIVGAAAAAALAAYALGAFDPAPASRVAAVATGPAGVERTAPEPAVAPAAAEPAAAEPSLATQAAETAAPDAAPEVVAQSDAATATDAAPAAGAVPLAERGYALGDVVVGDPSAPVTIYEYASLTCPHCATFHNTVLPELKTKYIDTGRVNLVVREVYFDPYGLYAAAVARCGGPEAYDRFLTVFFKRQAEWSRGADADAVVNEIRRLGRLGGLPPERVDACLTDQEFLTELFETSKTQVADAKIEATPTFVIAGETYRGARSVEEMSGVIDAALGQ